MDINLSRLSQLNDDESARAYLEKLRWPNGVACPHCGSSESYTLKPNLDSEKPVRKGVYKCKACRKQFTVTVGTIFEDSHIPLHKWLTALYLICSSKKGMSAHQLHRMLGVTYKSAWFMAHRIRYAMSQSPLAEKLSGVVEADETYIGGKAKGPRGRGAKNKIPVVALIQRNGDVRSFKTTSVNAKTLKDYIYKHIDANSTIMTDEFLSYKGLSKDFNHKTVNHGSGEYVNGDVYTNTAEGYFSILKRGITGIYHHVSDRYLSLYLNEFNFRYNGRKITDSERTALAVGNVAGKRLMMK